MEVTRRGLLGIGALAGARLLGACSDDRSTDQAGTGVATSADTAVAASPATDVSTVWRMPAEEQTHDRTWMCWPSSAEVWGPDLGSVQDAIARIALAIAEFEPVAMLARDHQLARLTDLVGSDVEVIAAPVDDLWARDTLPNLLVAAGTPPRLAASHARFNGWGDKQLHDGDAQLAALLANHLGIELFGGVLVGEGGGIEVDGRGTVLAAESCWVNDNRNPGLSRAAIEAQLLQMVGAQRMLWIPGLAGHDITDGHIDTLARFVGTTTILVDRPAVADQADPWASVAEQTRTLLAEATTADGSRYSIVEVTQPLEPRGSGDTFLSTYMNYYLCNGAVIAPEFGDAAADAAASDRLHELFPDRQIVMLDIDPLAAGGGGIHCATQQQPTLH